MKELMKVLSINSFVDFPQNYSILTEFWKQAFFKLTGIMAESYVSNQYGNGKEILDGNPIFSSKLNNTKGIRIIQIEQDIEQPILSSWINKIVINDVDFEELVIALQLKIETYTDVIQLIKLYFSEALTPIVLLGINEKYEISWDLEKMSYVINKYDYLPIFTDFNSLFESSLESKEFNLESIKQFSISFRKIDLHTFSIHESPIKRSFHIFIQNMGNIANILSLNATVDLEYIDDKVEYVLLIRRTLGSTKQYVDELHSYTTKAEEEYEFLKDHLHIQSHPW